MVANLAQPPSNPALQPPNLRPAINPMCDFFSAHFCAILHAR